MAEFDISEVDELVGLRGRAVVDPDGERIGQIEQIWVDNLNRLPEWALVKMGRSRGRLRYVSLRAAEIREQDVVVAYPRDHVEDAPDFDPGTATPRDEHDLYRHYGRPLPSPSPAEVRNPFARVQPVWAPTHWAGPGEAVPPPTPSG